MKKLLSIVCVCMAVALVFLMPACNNNKGDEPFLDGRLSIVAMNGSTMIGLGQFYNTVKNDANSKYKIEKLGTADAVIAGLANRTYDVACLPANNASILFNTQAVGIQVVAINTLNVLYVVRKASASAVNSLLDLAGKTVYLPGQGSTPEFVFRYLLFKNGINNVNLQFESEGATIATGIKTAGSKYDYAVLPQPVATVATSGAGAGVLAINLSDEWKKFNPNSDIVTGVLVVRTAFIKNNKDTLDKFLAEYKQSVEFMTAEENLDVASQYVVDMGVVPQVQIAKSALPKCGVTYVEKAEMKRMLVDFYTVLYAQNANAIGGKLPSDGFYYL